jgi:hypothetical protein
VRADREGRGAGVRDRGEVVHHPHLARPRARWSLA